MVFNYVKDDLGLLALTRSFTEGLEWVLDVTGNLLYGKSRWPDIGPDPVDGDRRRGGSRRLLSGRLADGAACGGGVRLDGADRPVGQSRWRPLSVLVVAAPLAFVIGLSLGHRRMAICLAVDRAIKPMLSVLQTLPFFTYLLPAVIFFKVGPTAGAVATTIYAIPPMILMTTLGLQKVPPEVVEAGQMSGCTRWQLLRHVYLPSARTEILVGVNQVIMLSLAMVVLTAFIGMPGLGAKLLAMMGSFKLGRSFEIGVTIVLLAVMLDRMSKAWASSSRAFRARHAMVAAAHPAAGLAVAAFVRVHGPVAGRPDRGRYRAQAEFQPGQGNRRSDQGASGPRLGQAITGSNTRFPERSGADPLPQFPAESFRRPP